MGWVGGGGGQLDIFSRACHRSSCHGLKKEKKKKRLQGWTSAYFCIYYTVIGRDLGYTIVKFSSNGTGLDTRVSHQSFSV